MSFIKIGSVGSRKLYDEIMSWKDKPMPGIKLLEAYDVFGRWDFALLFEADTNKNALHFAGDIVRPIEGVVAMRTIPLGPIRSWG
jgi:uncharacterized protein with GYD domain